MNNLELTAHLIVVLDLFLQTNKHSMSCNTTIDIIGVNDTSEDPGQTVHQITSIAISNPIGLIPIDQMKELFLSSVLSFLPISGSLCLSMFLTLYRQTSILYREEVVSECVFECNRGTSTRVVTLTTGSLHSIQ